MAERKPLSFGYDGTSPVSLDEMTSSDTIPSANIPAVYVAKNDPITPGTATKITYDAKGLVTSGTSATQDDIPDGITYKQYSLTEKNKLFGIEIAADVTDAANIAAAITAAGAETEPLDADEFPFYKIVGTILKKVTWVNIKATLKTYFDTVYTLANLGGIAHSLATAANDFIVASAPGVFVKKTLAETKAILGMTTTPTASKTPIADTLGRLDTWVTPATPRAMAQAIDITSAASGSNGIASASTVNNNMGTNNCAPYIEVAMADWTPSADQILWHKHDGTNGLIITLLTTGRIRLTINATTYNSTVAPGWADGSMHLIKAIITRSSASAAGSVVFIGDGKQIGDSVAITAGAPVTVDNTSSLYALGTSSTRTAGRIKRWGILNYAPSVAQALDFYINGPSYADRGASQTPAYASNFSAGVDGWANNLNTVVAGNVDSIGGEDDWLSVRADSTNGQHRFIKSITGLAGKNSTLLVTYYIPAINTNVTAIAMSGSTTVLSVVGTKTTVLVDVNSIIDGPFMYLLKGASYSYAGAGSPTDDIVYIKAVEIKYVGATLALEPEGIQPAPGQWLDSSGNKNHAMQPAAGSSIALYKNDFEFRWTNTWTASSAAQYIGGQNQSVLTAKHCIDTWETRATETTSVQNLEGGDGSDVDRFVAAFTPTTAPVNQTLANRISDGTNLKLVYTPAGSATMTIETIIKGHLLE